MSDAMVRRITNLLRLARDQEGMPEGATAQKMADLLMKSSGLQVELEERGDSDAKEAMLVVEPEPVPWPEYLGTMLATVYRCEYMPRWTGIAWQFWVYSTDPERVTACAEHYQFLARQIETRTDTLAARLLHLRSRDVDRYENCLSSYAEGLVYELSGSLLRRVGWRGVPPFMGEGFDEKAYRETAKDPMNPDEEPQDTGEPGLQRYRHVAPADAPFEQDPDTPPPPNRVLHTDPTMFARGRREGRHLYLIPGRLRHAFS